MLGKRGTKIKRGEKKEGNSSSSKEERKMEEKWPWKKQGEQ